MKKKYIKPVLFVETNVCTVILAGSPALTADPNDTTTKNQAKFGTWDDFDEDEDERPFGF